MEEKKTKPEQLKIELEENGAAVHLLQETPCRSHAFAAKHSFLIKCFDWQIPIRKPQIVHADVRKVKVRFTG